MVVKHISDILKMHTQYVLSSSIAKECPVDKHYNPKMQNCTGIFIKMWITINYTHALMKSKKLTICLVQYTCMTVQNYSDTMKQELVDLKKDNCKSLHSK